ncbi:MAG TPA: tetratricopeptide repeat-containing protein kinase family protein, partial [Gemmatimonadales bacterium]|nr:tetratricopeptide repeat-containing protein kinase family protein [Gemmatimonadales bacterium]
YLVMELVEGAPITAYADAGQLGIAARLELVLGVAEAVSAAHRQLVVHCDIKPSNILVDGEGRVRLLDFGIARLLRAERPRTEPGARVLTPDYASPEQLRGDPVTTATDVYQLGLLLRELLAGRLAGEPALIAEAALCQEPERRYPTADAFAADVRRYLAGVPTVAHPASGRYRARTFLARHPAVLPAVALVVVALGGFIAALTWQNRRLERERDVAAAALSRARETQAFFVNLFRSPDPWAPADPVRGRDITVREALLLGATRTRDELDRQPALRAALLSTIGAVLLSLDQVADARGMLEEAVALRTRIGFGTTEELSDDLGRLGNSLDGLNLHDSARVVLTRRLDLERRRTPLDSARLSRGLRDLAVVHFATGPLEEAVALLEEAAAVLRGADPVTRAAALIQLSDGYRKADRVFASEAAAREALRLAEVGVGPDDPSTATAAYTLAKTLGMVGRFEEATALFSRSLAVLTRRLGSDHAYTIGVRNDFGYLLVRAEDYPRAEIVFRELLEANRRKHGGDGHSSVATSLQNLAGAMLGQRRYEAAERLTREAESIFRRVTPSGSYIIAYPMLTRSEIQLARNDYRGAARTADSAASLLRGLVLPSHPAAVVADCRLGQAYAGLGRLTEARSLLASVGERLEFSEGLREIHREECRAALSAAAGSATGPRSNGGKVVPRGGRGPR